MLAGLFALMAEYERNIISERTKAGLRRTGQREATGPAIQQVRPGQGTQAAGSGMQYP